MKAIYGLVGTSLPVAVDKLKKLCKNNDVNFNYINKKQPKTIKSSNVVVLSGVKALKLNLEYLNKSKVVAVVADNPLSLMEIGDIQFLDAKPIPAQSFRYNLHAPDWNLVVSSLSTDANVIVSPQKVQFIPRLLDAQKVSTFLDVYQTLAYRVFDVTKRNRFIPAFYNYMAGVNRSVYPQIMQEISPKRGFGKEKYIEFQDMVNSDYGKALSKALQECKSDAKLEDIATKHKVDSFDLRFLFKSRRKLLKETGSMSDVINHAVNKTKNSKLGAKNA